MRKESAALLGLLALGLALTAALFVTVEHPLDEGPVSRPGVTLRATPSAPSIAVSTASATPGPSTSFPPGEGRAPSGFASGTTSATGSPAGEGRRQMGQPVPNPKPGRG